MDSEKNKVFIVFTDKAKYVDNNPFVGELRDFGSSFNILLIFRDGSYSFVNDRDKTENIKNVFNSNILLVIINDLWDLNYNLWKNPDRELVLFNTLFSNIDSIAYVVFHKNSPKHTEQQALINRYFKNRLKPITQSHIDKEFYYETLCPFLNNIKERNEIIDEFEKMFLSYFSDNNDLNQKLDFLHNLLTKETIESAKKSKLMNNKEISDLVDVLQKNEKGCFDKEYIKTLSEIRDKVLYS